MASTPMDGVRTPFQFRGSRPADAQSSSKASWPRNGRSSAAGDQASADYAFDETDWDTIELGIFDTDDEKPDGWYAYPLVGSSATLEVSLAHSVGSEVMSIRVAGAESPELRLRTDTLLAAFFSI